jgi:hypothetical protein
VLEEDEGGIECYHQAPSVNAYSTNVFTCPHPVEECYKYVCVGNGTHFPISQQWIFHGTRPLTNPSNFSNTKPISINL